MQNLRVNVFLKLTMAQDLGQIPCHQEDTQGWPNAFAFLSIDKYHLEFYAKFEGQRFLETGDVSRPGTNSMWLGGSPRVAYRICFYFCRQMSVWILCEIWGSTFSRNWRCLKTWDKFHVIRRVSKSGLTHLPFFFLSSNISLELYAKFDGQRFL